jgi:hypothetical protein
MAGRQKFLEINEFEYDRQTDGKIKFNSEEE